MSEIALSCRNITVVFDQFKALDNVALDIEKNKIIALIGPNGAGKTTLLNALSGRIPLRGGVVELDGKDITHMPVNERVKNGFGRSFQIINIFQEMSVFENLILAQQPLRFKFQPFIKNVHSYDDLKNKAVQIAEMMGLSDALHEPASTLSHGKQRAVELAITLISDPKILLLDEPLAGVGQNEIQETFELIKKVSTDKTILLVEHNMDVVMQLADEIIVMLAGQILVRGTPEEISKDPRVREAYLGKEEEVEHA